MEKDAANRVLLAICSIAKPGEYVIMNRTELAQNLTEGYDKKDIDKSMMQLQADDYVSVRYSDADVYCLSVLNKGFVFGEKLREKEQQRLEEERLRNLPAPSGEEAQTAEVAAVSDEGAQNLPAESAVKSDFRFPWKKMFVACVTGAFAGGALAGTLVAILMKLFLR